MNGSKRGVVIGYNQGLTKKGVVMDKRFLVLIAVASFGTYFHSSAFDPGLQRRVLGSDRAAAAAAAKQALAKYGNQPLKLMTYLGMTKEQLQKIAAGGAAKPASTPGLAPAPVPGPSKPAPSPEGPKPTPPAPTLALGTSKPVLSLEGPKQRPPIFVQAPGQEPPLKRPKIARPVPVSTTIETVPGAQKAEEVSIPVSAAQQAVMMPGAQPQKAVVAGMVTEEVVPGAKTAQEVSIPTPAAQQAVMMPGAQPQKAMVAGMVTEETVPGAKTAEEVSIPTPAAQQATAMPGARPQKAVVAGMVTEETVPGAKTAEEVSIPTPAAQQAMAMPGAQPQKATEVKVGMVKVETVPGPQTAEIATTPTAHEFTVMGRPELPSPIEVKKVRKYALDEFPMLAKEQLTEKALTEHLLSPQELGSEPTDAIYKALEKKILTSRPQDTIVDNIKAEEVYRRILNLPGEYTDSEVIKAYLPLNQKWNPKNFPEEGMKEYSRRVQALIDKAAEGLKKASSAKKSQATIEGIGGAGVKA